MFPRLGQRNNGYEAPGAHDIDVYFVEISVIQESIPGQAVA
jgi:hypothetical protein